MKSLRILGIGLLVAIPFLTMKAQKALTPQDLEAWKRITARAISDDGQWVSAVFSPWKGDAEVQVFSAAGKQIKAYTPASEVKFSSSSQYALIKQVPALALTDSLKLKKARKDKMPMDELVVLNLKSGSEWKIDSLKSYRLAETGDWMAYQRTRKDSSLVVTSLDGMKKIVLPSASGYGFAKESPTLYFVTKDTINGKPGMYVWTPDNSQPVLIKEGKGLFLQPTFDKTGNKLAFLYTDDKKEKDYTMSLWIAENAGEARELATRATIGLPGGWVISPNQRLSFSDDASRLFLGTAPAPLRKDTTVLDANRPNVQVWNWDEPVQYTVQHYNVKRDLKKSYAAVYWLNTQKLVQIANEELPDAQLPVKGMGDWAIVSTSKPYSVSSMWEGRTRADYYKVSLATGERTLIAKADYAGYRLSPAAKYAGTYNQTDSCWYTISLADNRKIRLTTPQSFPAWDEESDYPDYPRPHGYAGWTKDDAALLIYDRYDIWSFDPEGKKAPVKLTKNGRENKITYRRINLDREQEFVDLTKPVMMTGFNEVGKTTGIYRARLNTPVNPTLLAGGKYNLGNVVKAKKTDKYIYTRENYEVYPDIWATDASFKKGIQLTQGISQQEPYIWGTAELISWTSLDGKPLEGVIYKPANFDPNKKYPMIVNFYERNSETLYEYHMPEAHRSTIDYSLYLSNGYIVFNPDVRYRDGYPGESCYNCVMPGIAEVLSRGYVDAARIGAQGHSWGGYQVAYLATRTRLFAAIESGAPVVNMFSAYGGIRWGSGLARSFQYEHTQSRLGATPWSDPRRYYENSPLFLMDKVETPILIMHNDQDGHVPWYQGIEYFVALKRLGKPAWMLNYTGEPHWPTKLPNKLDFQIRMKQFFDHFLKGETMPKWMKEGVPAVKQPYELGY
ncbi:MAG: S9 family peptidase [Bacteroides sp.]|nr:S9 family peptidase [Bacteroides sp.]